MPAKSKTAASTKGDANKKRVADAPVVGGIKKRKRRAAPFTNYIKKIVSQEAERAEVEGNVSTTRRACEVLDCLLQKFIKDVSQSAASFSKSKNSSTVNKDQIKSGIEHVLRPRPTQHKLAMMLGNAEQAKQDDENATLFIANIYENGERALATFEKTVKKK